MKFFAPILSIAAAVVLAIWGGYLRGKYNRPEAPSCVKEDEALNLAALGDFSRNTYPFGEVIEATSGFRVLPTGDQHHELMRVLHVAGQEISDTMSEADSPVREKRRINEASALFEDALREKLNAHPDFECDFAPNRHGNSQRSGYPDLRLLHLPTQTVAYLDPKLFEESSIRSSFRTFYYEPASETGKVTEDALHLLIGFPHDGNSGAWTCGKPTVVDLSTLRLTLKTEFSASNRDLYQEFEPTP